MAELNGKTSFFNDAADVTHSSAFVILDTLIDEGQITQERADYLKKKFKDLHSRVLTIYNRDNVLLKRARRLRAELDEQCKKIQACGEGARKDDIEIQNLKKKLTKAERELVAAQDQESVLQVEVLEYDRQKQSIIMEREDAIAEEEARLRPLMENLQSEIKSINVEVEQLASVHTALTTKLEGLCAEEATYQAETNELLAAVEQEKIQLSIMQRDPERAIKQAQLVERNLANTEREIQVIEEKLALQAEAISRKELQCSNIESDRVAAEAALQQLNNDIATKQKTLATLNSSLEAELESKREYQERLVQLAQLIKTKKAIVQQQEDELERRQHDRERVEAECQAMEEEREALIKELHELKEQTHRKVKEEESLEHECRELQRQMDSTQKSLETRRAKMIKDQKNEAEFKKRVETVLEDINNTDEMRAAKERQTEARHVELMGLTLRRQELMTECARAEDQLRVLHDRIDAQKLREAEAERKRQENEQRLRKLTSDYRRVRRAGVLKSTQVQKLTDKLAEMDAQKDALNAELDQLLSDVAESEKELLAGKREIHEVSQQYAHLSVEHNEQQKRLEEIHNDEVAVRTEMERTSQDLASLKEQLQAVEQEYEHTEDDRHQMSIKLVDGNDEMALLDEKIRVEEAALREGAAMSQARAEEMRRLNIRLADIHREIENCQRVLPQVSVLEKELAQLQTELDDEQWRVDVLEAELVDPHNKQRWNKLTHVISRHAGEGTATTSLAVRAGADGQTSPSRAIAETTTTTTTTMGGAPEGLPVSDAATNELRDTHMNIVHNSNIHQGDGDARIDDDASRTRDDNHASRAMSQPAGATNAAHACTPAVASVSTREDVLADDETSEVYVQLQARCHELETQLERVNAQLREKQLVLQEVTELSERIGQQAEAGRDVTHTLARKMNDNHSTIRQRTRQMMATISELSLFQASSIQLQQEVERLQGMVSSAEERMQDGQAPFAEAEEEYRRMQESNRRYAAMLQRRQQEEAERQEEQANLGDGGYNIGQVGAVAPVRTTAVRRPNVYVPEDELGLPKPFGCYAPFHPTATHLSGARGRELNKTRTTMTTTPAAATRADAAAVTKHQLSHRAFRGSRGGHGSPPRHGTEAMSSSSGSGGVLSAQPLRYPQRPPTSSSPLGSAPVANAPMVQTRPASTTPRGLSRLGDEGGGGVAGEDGLSATPSAAAQQKRLSSRHSAHTSFAASR